MKLKLTSALHNLKITKSNQSQPPLWPPCPSSSLSTVHSSHYTLSIIPSLSFLVFYHFILVFFILPKIFLLIFVFTFFHFNKFPFLSFHAFILSYLYPFIFSSFHPFLLIILLSFHPFNHSSFPFTLSTLYILFSSNFIYFY